MPLLLLMVVLLPMIPIGLPILVIGHLEMSSSMLGLGQVARKNTGGFCRCEVAPLAGFGWRASFAGFRGLRVAQATSKYFCWGC